MNIEICLKCDNGKGHKMILVMVPESPKYILVCPNCNRIKREKRPSDRKDG